MTNAGECEEKGTLLYCWWECKLVHPLQRTLQGFLRRLKITLPYDLVIPLLGIYSDKTISQEDTCTTILIAELFTISKKWKHSECSLTDEWIKMWYIHTISYYSATKKNEIMSFVATKMQLEIIILSEISQKQKDKYHMMALICGI